jgi:hypothetical protein
MKTTRRGFLKGVGVTVGGLVAGIKPKLEELPPEVEEEVAELPELVEDDVTEGVVDAPYRTTASYCGRNYDGGILIDGVPYSGSFSLSFDHDQVSYRMWGAEQILYTQGLSEGHADLQLLVEDVVTLPLYADQCKLELKSDYGFRCDARVESIEYHKDVPLVDVSLSCWNLVEVYEYA